MSCFEILIISLHPLILNIVDIELEHYVSVVYNDNIYFIASVMPRKRGSEKMSDEWVLGEVGFSSHGF